MVTSVIKVPLGAAEQARYIRILSAASKSLGVSPRTMRTVLMKLTSGAPLTFGDVNISLPKAAPECALWAHTPPHSPRSMRILASYCRTAITGWRGTTLGTPRR